MDILTVLADPTRRRIVEALAGGERSVGEIVTAVGVSQPSASRHLKVLRTSGLVSVRVDAQRRRYSLDPGPFGDLEAWLRSLQPGWASRLDALEAHLHHLPTDDPNDDPTDDPTDRLPEEHR